MDLCRDTHPLIRALFDGIESFCFEMCLWYFKEVDKQLGSYFLKDILGAGSRTTVYRGVHRSLPHLEVAVKVLHPHLVDLPQVRATLRERASRLAQLHHPRVVHLLDYIEEGPHCAMIVERVTGASLATLLERETPFSIRYAEALLRSLLEAIGHTHGQQIAHGALTLERVWVTEGGWLKVLDFEGTQMTAAGVRMDLVAINHILSSLLLGRSVQHQTPTQTQLENAGASSGLAALLMGLGQASSSRNFGSCGEALASLEEETGQGDARRTVTEIAFPACTVNFSKQVIQRVDGKTKRLAGVERELLLYLTRYPRQVISRERLMREVWNVRGHVITRAVDVTVRRLREKIEQDASNPAHILTVHGQGYRFEPPADASSSTTAPILVAQSQKPRNVFAGVLGREADVAQLETLYGEGAPLITIIGPGGMGKTTLSRVFSEGRPQAFLGEGRVFFCDLQATTDLESIVIAVANALDAPTHGDENDVALIGAFLTTQDQSLVLLDNFEQVAGYAADTLGQWMKMSPATRFLVTSQAVLGLPGEQVHELLPLTTEAAVALFIDRAKTLRREFEPGPEDLQAIHDIVAALDGIPLPIELAASRIRVLSPQQLYRRLADRLDLLKQRNTRESPRTATLRGAIEWSWQWLEPEEKSLLTQAAVFAGGFTAEAAECVLDPDDSDLFVLEILQSLVDKSLLRSVRVETLPGERRFQFFESIHHFLKEQLNSRADKDAILSRHQAYYLGEGERLAERVRAGKDATDAHRLALDMDNLLAIERSGARDPKAAVRACLCVEPLLAARGPLGVFVRVLDTAVALSDGLSPDLQVQVLLARIRRRRDVSQLQGPIRDDLNAARRCAEGHPYLMALVDTTEARTFLVNQGHIKQARVLLEPALVFLQEWGDHATAADTRWQLARCAELEADFDTAETIARHAIQQAITHGLHTKTANLRRMLGVMLCNCSRLEEAEEELVEALAIFEAFGDSKLIATCQIVLGDICFSLGRLEETLQRAQSAYRLSLSLGNETSAGLALCTQGRVELDRLSVKAARSILLKAMPMLDTMLPGKCFSLMHIAASWILSHDIDRALVCAREAIEVLPSGSFLIGQFFCRLTYALALAADQQLKEAAKELQKAEKHLPKLEQTSQLAYTLCAIMLAKLQGHVPPEPPESLLLETHLKRSAELRLLTRLIEEIEKNK